MFWAVPSPAAAHPRIHIDGVPVEAWIEHGPRRHRSTDWTLWFERGGRSAHGKRQLRLEIESKLKAWLLRKCHAPFSTLSFDELRLIAEGNEREALRAHAGALDTLPPRPKTPPIPSVSAPRSER